MVLKSYLSYLFYVSIFYAVWLVATSAPDEISLSFFLDFVKDVQNMVVVGVVSLIIMFADNLIARFSQPRK